MNKIAQMNDELRKTFVGGHVVMTKAVASLDEQTQIKVFRTVQTFDDFNEDNDPYEEHDMAFFVIDGEKYFWKVDYYAHDMLHGSEDPSDAEQTVRVLTIGLATDY